MPHRTYMSEKGYNKCITQGQAAAGSEVLLSSHQLPVEKRCFQVTMQLHTLPSGCGSHFEAAAPSCSLEACFCPHLL